MNDVTDGDVEALRERIRRLEAMLAASGTNGSANAQAPATATGAGASVLPAIPPHSGQVPEGQPPYYRTRCFRFKGRPHYLCANDRLRCLRPRLLPLATDTDMLIARLITQAQAAEQEAERLRAAQQRLQELADSQKAALQVCARGWALK